MTRRLSLALKFFLTHLATAGVVMLIAGIATYFSARSLVLSDADETLFNKATLIAETFRPLLADQPLDLSGIAQKGDQIGRVSGTRLTIVLPGGMVVADSTVGAEDVPKMANHENHPEVHDALLGQLGFSQRRSITIREKMRYAALPIEEEGTVIGVVRTAIPTSLLDMRIRQITTVLWSALIAALLILLAGAAILARRITGPLAEMKEAVREIGAGNLARVVHVRTRDELEDVATAVNAMAAQLSETIRQLDAGKTRLSTLLAGLSDGVIVITPDRTVRMMNQAAGNVLDASKTITEGRPYPEAIRLPQVLPFIDGWMNGNAPTPRYITVPSAGGERIVRVSGTTVNYRGETVADVLILLHDMTEERRLSQIKSDFVTNASHELRTPLTNVRGYLETYMDAIHKGEAPDREFLDIVHSNVLRMEHLINDLLLLSQSESGAVPLEKEKITVSAFLSRIAELHNHDAEALGKTLETASGEGTFQADPRTLTAAVSNLVDNAIKYGKEGGRITISGKIEEGDFLLEVADNGPGIPAEHLPRLFERFYRVDKDRSRKSGGTGLGLSIARRIVESHGGSIQAASRLGEGTQFTIRLPA
ncbi:MAG: cell wall metabolism sensor histidine kinase WalK [Syntrophorhabdaceae bacterium]|nr:cell wall metabolism sensor histidine kinase WalK [Syntrophorhabdaceae bacterium]